MSHRYQFHRASVEDASAIFDIINEAYAVEHGNDGIAFKNCPRLDEPLEQFMLDAYEQKRIIKAVDESGKIVGMLSFEVNSDHVYFGPFAVSAAVKGTGLGKLLMNELHDIAYAAKVPYIDMNVVNWRADLIPMYEKMGFKQISEQPFPEPHKLTRPSTLLMYRKVCSQYKNRGLFWTIEGCGAAHFLLLYSRSTCCCKLNLLLLPHYY